MDQETVDELLRIALNNQSVATLYETINAASSISIEPSIESYWASSTDPIRTIISIAPTSYPAESMFHELLHAQMKLKGYKQYLTFVRTADNALVKVLSEALDNELQHHRMFPVFVNAGFDPKRFYNENDYKAYTIVRKELKKMKPEKTSPGEYFLKYLTIVAPGGAGGERQRQQLKNFFKARVPNEKMKKIDQAFEELNSWRISSATDPGPTILKIMTILGDMEGWWIGISQDFPKAGYFIGKPFTSMEAKSN
jgi:hypothetical protein